MNSKLVINWKNPPEVVESSQVEEYFKALGITAAVFQTRRVPSGLLNTTFTGESSELLKVWLHIKRLEKEHIINQRKKKESKHDS